MGADRYAEPLTSLYAGRSWIVVGDTVAGAVGRVRRLTDAGAIAAMIVAASKGTGQQPHDDVSVFVTGTTAPTLMGAIRAFAAVLASPSTELCSAIDSFDPARKAHVLSNYEIPDGELHGRPVLAPPDPRWRGLEDKITVDNLWDRAGVARAPSRIVDSTDEDAIRAAASGLATSDGVVLVADNTEGWHGGGEYTRHLAPGSDWSTALRFFAEHSRRVRVTPYMHGVPCSIHGLVTEDAVLAFRPVEMLVYRRPGSDEFVYAGTDTVWDPPPQVCDQMQDAVRVTGTLIRAEADYRGAFGIDGVCTNERFLPTELNPRLTTGLRIQAEAAGTYPIDDINRAIVAGLDVDLHLSELEHEIVAGADAVRVGSWFRPITHVSATETIDQPISYDGSSWTPASRDDPSATATMSFGPGPHGSLVTVRLSERHGLTPGSSIAGIAAASFELADELWDTRIGTLVSG
jgi:hypothetical protein